MKYKKYCRLLKCFHLDRKAGCDGIYDPLDISCCHVEHICDCMPKGYQDILWFFIWKKELEEKRKNELSKV